MRSGYLRGMDTRYVTPRQAAMLLGVTPSTLSAWRKAGRGPRYSRMGEARQSRVRYPVEELDKWMRRQMVGV